MQFPDDIEDLADVIEVADCLAGLFECGTRVVHFENFGDDLRTSFTIEVGLSESGLDVSYGESDSLPWEVGHHDDREVLARAENLGEALKAVKKTADKRSSEHIELGESLKQIANQLEGIDEE